MVGFDRLEAEVVGQFDRLSLVDLDADAAGRQRSGMVDLA
jgi:hypothetical protein